MLLNTIRTSLKLRKRPKLALYLPPKQKRKDFRFVLGVGRSGTSWITTVLAQSPTPMRVLLEPINSLSPKYKKNFDTNALSFNDLDSIIHAKICERLSLPQLTSKTLQVKTRRVPKNDKSFEKIIIKEVHGLLATQFLLDYFKIPMIALIRNPYYIVDSQIFYLGLNQPGLKNEYRYIQQPSFIERFFNEKSGEIVAEFNKIKEEKNVRTRLTLERLLVVAAINKMFIDISEQNPLLKIFYYEEILTNPKIEFINMAKHLNLKTNKHFNDFVKKTTKSNTTEYNPNSIYRNTSKQKNKELNFFNKEIIDKSVSILDLTNFKKRYSL